MSPESMTVIYRNGRDRRSTMSTSGNRYSCTVNQLPNATETAGEPVANGPLARFPAAKASFQNRTASANTHAENVAPVTFDSIRSEGVQPSSHPNANTAKTTPGANTTKTKMACEGFIRPLLRRWFETNSESRPWGDAEVYSRTIRRRKVRPADVPNALGTPQSRHLSTHTHVQNRDRSWRA